MSSSTNPWLRAQRKSDLVELAEQIGLKDYETLKKTELETALDEYITDHSSRLAKKSKLSGYFSSRSRGLGSPVKRERDESKDEVDRALRLAKRKAIRAAEEIASEDEQHGLSSPAAAGSSTALINTPGRSLASRIPLPASPADVANAVDRSTVAVRKRVSSLYQESGISEVSQATRETLSTVTSVLFCVSAFELYYLRPEILANRYAFTIPATRTLGTPDQPVYLPDMFLLLTSSFWSPALTWTLTSVVLPSLFGYFFNLSAANVSAGARSRARSHHDSAVVDLLTFSIVKALVCFVVYGQGATLCGLLDELSITRIESAVYGGYKGMLVGAAITGLVSIYDAVLKK